MKIVFIRHGQSTANAIGMLQGMKDFELSEVGVRQAKAVAQKISTSSFDYIYVSQLKRAIDTAKEIATYHHVIPLHIDTRLAERSLGVFEGRVFKDIMEEYSLSSADTRSMIEAHESTNISRDLLLDKKAFLEDMKVLGNVTVCVVGHGGTLYGFRAIMFEKAIEYMPCGNTSIWEFEWNGECWKELLQNNLSHLS